jgi:hypothetical protein
VAQYFHQALPADGKSIGGQAPSTKVSKVRDAMGSTVLSKRGNMWKRKKLKRTANAARGGNERARGMRSWIASQRGYWAGPSGLRGAGRDTGTVNLLAGSSRADLTKVSAPGRVRPVGVYLPKAGG